MPKKAPHSVAWITSANASANVYELREGPHHPPIQIQAPDSSWFAWLSDRTSFSFSGKNGQLTARRESRRGGSYWYAYRRQGKRLQKKYLGRVEELTFQRLEEAAGALSARGDDTARDASRRKDPGSGPGGKLPPVLDSQESRTPILFPKLRPPSLRAALVPRQRLLSRLEAGLERSLILLAAPAGFGKTTLISQWIRQLADRKPAPTVAWVSLDPGDNDPVRFWRYLITACQPFLPDGEKSGLAILQGSGGPGAAWFPSFGAPSLDLMLTRFINEITQFTGDGILILDDYHQITSPQVHETLARLIEHLPPALHLALLTRSTPPLPLTRMRMHDEMTELNAGDLRFTEPEIQEFFQQSIPGALSTEMLQRLEARAEGWAAGLRLLAITLQKHASDEEIRAYISTFSGNQRQILEYFVGEVLEAQPGPVQDFLLRTSILNRLTGSLCEAVTGRADSEQLLAHLEGSGLFLLPLDEAGQWYHYHTLFAEAMQHEARLRLGEAALVEGYRRASAWYEQQGMLAETVEAALAAGEFARASQRIEQFTRLQQFNERHEAYTLQRWLGQIPDSVLFASPTLCLLYAQMLVFAPQSDQIDPVTLVKVEALLQNAEENLRRAGNRAHLGEILAFRALLAGRQMDLPLAADYARQALPYLPEDDNSAISRSICLSVIGEEQRQAGRMVEASQWMQQGLQVAKAAGHEPGIRVTSLGLAEVCFAQGELHQAEAYYHQVLVNSDDDLADREKACLGLAKLAYEWNDLERAQTEAEKALDLAGQLSDLPVQARAALVLAQIEQAGGQTTAAQERLSTLLVQAWPPHLASIQQEVLAGQARLNLGAGNLAAVQRWVTNTALREDFPLQDEEQLLLTRWYLAQDHAEEALRSLAQVQDSAAASGRQRNRLEAQVLASLAHSRLKQAREARKVLREALTLAFPERYMRIFLDHGEEMAVLLQAIASEVRERTLSGYLQSLLAAFRPEIPEDGQGASRLPSEPLSLQEQRVLHLLASDLSRPEIARALVVSVNTVKTHIQRIYQKLHVTSREEAVEAARRARLI